jgi:uncharacterized protein (DUF1684 family)
MWGRREWMTASLSAPLSRLFGDSLPYGEQIEEWRRSREASLKADDGWLTVAGLHWLSQGVNLVEGAAGVEFLLYGDEARVRIAGSVMALVNGEAVREAPLKSDTPGPPDLVTMGSLTMFVIERGERFAIRVRDTGSRYRKEFTGLTWYPVKPEYRVTGRLLQHASPLTVSIPTILGYDDKMTSPGVIRFRLGGRERSLRPVLSGGRLFLIFKDQTAGKTTYPAGRFLYADMPEESGEVELDFNKAYNPPCAYTPYATCPLPPRENRLALRIEAGELNYHHD